MGRVIEDAPEGTSLNIFSDFSLYNSSHESEPSCCVCGSKRQRNLITKKHLFLKSGSVEYETRCKRCWDAYELLGDGKDRVHPVGSNPTGKPAYRYLDRNQARRMGAP
jgi:hypothetical protein